MQTPSQRFTATGRRTRVPLRGPEPRTDAVPPRPLKPRPLDGRRRTLCSGSPSFPSPGCALPFPQGSLGLGIGGIPDTLVTHWPFPLLCTGTQAERPARPCQQAAEFLSGGVRDSSELTRQALLSCGTVSGGISCRTASGSLSLGVASGSGGRSWSSTAWSRSHTHPVFTDDLSMQRHSS